jgi:small conductance mechanosensitive channel
MAASATPAAATVIHPQPGFIETMQVMLVDSGIRLVAAVIILCVGWMLSTYVKRWLAAGLEHIPFDPTLKPLLASLVRYAILIVTLILVLEQFGVQTTSLIAVIGAAGLAIGLAMQGTLSNVAAGVMLLILRPFRVGHFISAGGQSGTVREIGLFTTMMVTRDLVFISIPNSTIFSGVIANYTSERLRRVTFTVPVDRSNDLARVEETVLAAIAANPQAMKEPAPSVVVSDILDNSMVMAVRAYARSADYWQVLYALRRQVTGALERANILMPAPRQAVEVRKGSGAVAIAPLAPQENMEDKNAEGRDGTQSEGEAAVRDRSAMKRIGGKFVR